MIQFGSQQALDGSHVALLVLITYFCQAGAPEGESRAQCVLLLFLARAVESLDDAPPSLAALHARLRRALGAYPETLTGVQTYLDQWFALLWNVDGLAELFHSKVPECLCLVPEDADQATIQLLDRRSYLGLYVRRARLAFEMLLDPERLQLAAMCAAWRDGDAHGLADEWRQHSQARAFLQWRTSARKGDYAAAKNELHAFFDLTIPGCEQELHQHALLNLAQFHIHTKGYPAARTTLDEAILLARTVGDTECMRACDDLLQQLAYLDPEPGKEHAWLLTRRDTDTQLACGAYSPLALWKADRDAEHGKPLLAIVQSLANATWASRSSDKHAPGPDWEPRPSIERSAACASAVLAQTWLRLGVPALAEAYTAHVARLEESAPRSWPAMRLRTAATRAYASAERGAYDAAVCELVAPRVVRLVADHAQLDEWQQSLWRIAYLRARRQRHTASLRRLAELCPGLDTDAQVAPPTQRTLDEAKDVIAAQQPYQSLDRLMQAIASAEKQNLYPLQRSGLACLAEIMTTSLQLPEQALATLSEILPQALADANAERRAYAMCVYAKCLLATQDIQGARTWLARAQQGTPRASHRLFGYGKLQRTRRVPVPRGSPRAARQRPCCTRRSRHGLPRGARAGGARGDRRRAGRRPGRPPHARYRRAAACE